MVTDELEKALRVGPKFIYVLPNFQNPSGTTLSLERRQRLVELADRYGVPIVEDDPYGQLRFEGEHLPSVVSLDSEYRGDNGYYTGNVIYLSTFSKLLAPGIRLAWVIAPEEVIRKLVQTKQAADLNTAAFNQMTAYEVGKDGFLDEHVKHIRAVYKERRDVMLEMMEEMFPAEVRWTMPPCGAFYRNIWTLPKCSRWPSSTRWRLCRARASTRTAAARIPCGSISRIPTPTPSGRELPAWGLS
jgi:2-aminoadipate transaminase